MQTDRDMFGINAASTVKGWSRGQQLTLFQRLCCDYSSEMLDGLIASKQIKVCMIQGAYVYDSAKRLVDQHLIGASAKARDKRELAPLSDYAGEYASWDEADMEEVANAVRVVNENMNRADGFGFSGDPGSRAMFLYSDGGHDSWEEGDMSDCSLMDDCERDGGETNVLPGGKIIYDSSDDEAPSGSRRVIRD